MCAKWKKTAYRTNGFLASVHTGKCCVFSHNVWWVDKKRNNEQKLLLISSVVSFLSFNVALHWKTGMQSDAFICILSISQCMYADESLYGRVCVSRCVFLQLQPTSPHAAINAAVSPPLSLSSSLSDIHSNDPCLSHAGTMLWIPSKQKNKWRLLCKWICGGPCAGGEKWQCLYPYVGAGWQ